MTSKTLTLISSDGARAVIHAHGAHVTSWVPAGGTEQLFLSERAVLDGSAPIRGGIPVIFPQFASEGSLPKHGFARTRRWSLLDDGLHGAVDAEGRAVVRWQLVDDEATRLIWPQSFRAELRVMIIGSSLAVMLVVENTGSDSFAFTAALHTYLAVGDIDDVAVHGLQHLRYRDSAGGGREHVEQPEALRFDGEVDRVYFDAPADLTVRSGNHVLLAQSAGFADVVVWNPGEARATGFADLAPEEWRRFVCIEPAAIGTPARLAPGERWEGMQTLTVRPPSL